MTVPHSSSWDDLLENPEKVGTSEHTDIYCNKLNSPVYDLNLLRNIHIHELSCRVYDFNLTIR